MGKNKNTWAGGNIPIIESHGRTKHSTLRKYIEDYLLVVSNKGIKRDRLKLALVDGFAGGGIYANSIDDINPDYFGSPFVLQEAVNKAKSQILINNPNFNLEVDFYFIEKNKDAFNSLKAVNDKHYQNTGGNYLKEFMNGEFLDKLDEVINRIRSKDSLGRSIFILDPFGITQLGNLFNTFSKIFSRLKKAEIIFTFQIDWLTHYLTENKLGVLEKLGLNIYSINLIKKLLNEKNEVTSRLAVQKIIYDAICQSNYIEYFVPFCIKSESSHKSYLLLHLSNHIKARDVMIDAIWQQTHHFIHEGKCGYKMFGFTDKDTLPQTSYLFDDDSEKNSINVLPRELIDEKLLDYNLQYAFHLYNRIANEIPLNRIKFYQLIRIMVDEDVLYSCKEDENGNYKKTVQITDNTLIRRNRQLLIQF